MSKVKKTEVVKSPLSAPTVADLESKIRQLTNEVIELRETVFKQRDEIHSLRNSRVLGRIIKVRDRIGDPHTLPVRSYYKARFELNRARRFTAQYVPDSVRLPLMRSLRSARDSVKGVVKKTAPQITYIEVENQLWPKAKPLVSVVIPYYNRADTIDDTLRSLAVQTFTDFEVLLVNDGSPDEESVEKLREIERVAPHITIIHQENQGVAVARNTGISKARGKYIICLDSDDMIDATFIEKAATVLETDPNVSIVSSYMTVFGVKTEEFQHSSFSPTALYKDNMIITAAMFKKDAWKGTGGYKSGIGYEDWEFWITLVENGHWVYQIEEPLFQYRTSMQSRYVEDRDVHWENLKKIHSLHPEFKSKAKALTLTHKQIVEVVKKQTALVNLNRVQKKDVRKKDKVLITIPWMTFGGAETLIANFCQEVKDQYQISFVTGLKSKNEWEYKFKDISDEIYHLPNILPSEELFEDYISHLITQQEIGTLHIIHNGFTFAMIENLKRKHHGLRVIVTLFNDRAAYFDQSLEVKYHIDTFTTDNSAVAQHYARELEEGSDVRVIPNGINSSDIFNPSSYDRSEVRAELNLEDDELAVFFVGRLSEEKNPDVFIEAAQKLLQAKSARLKFFVIGDGPMRAKVDTMFHNIDDERLVYLGYQSQVARFLSAADIFVLPSSIEGFPLSVLEAMSMEVAVIASDVGAVADVIESGVDGVVITPGSVDDIVKAVTMLLSDAKALSDMQRKARRKVEAHYSNLQLGTNYKNLYEQ